MPIRVLWLIKGLGPGGAERLLVSHAETADRSAFDLSAAYLVPEKQHLVGELAALDVPSTCLGDGRDWPLRLRRHLIEHPVDVVHVHSPSVAVAARVVVRTVPKAVRPKLAYTEHNVWDNYGWATRLANAATYPLDQARVAVSAPVLASMPGPWRRRTEVVVHGVPMARIVALKDQRAAVRAELGLDDDDVAVITVANYRAAKAYPDLLAAAAKVVADQPRARFFAVGQGPLADEIEAVHARLGLGERFRLLGYRPDAPRLVAGCDLFAMSSLQEGYPIAVMEAMALGLPVVATRVGGLPDAITPDANGLLVDPGEPDQLATALSALIGDDERRARLSGGATEKASEYDIARAVTRLEARYRELVPGP